MDDNTSPSISESAIDWNACILCQTVTLDTLQCPAKSKRSNIGQGYKTFADNLAQFLQIDSLPLPIPHLSQLNDGSGIENTLMKQKAKWHKNCVFLFKKTKLDRAIDKCSKRQSGEYGGPLCKLTRQSMSKPKDHKSVCFFCDEVGSLGVDLHQVMTDDVEQKINKHVHLLQDEKLMAKLGTGDLIAMDIVYHKRCITTVTRPVEKELGEDKESIDESILIDLNDFIAEQLASEDFGMIKLSDIRNMYTDKCREVGISRETKVHATRLKERLLSMNADISAHILGRDTVFALKENIRPGQHKTKRMPS